MSRPVPYFKIVPGSYWAERALDDYCNCNQCGCPILRGERISGATYIVNGRERDYEFCGSGCRNIFEDDQERTHAGKHAIGCGCGKCVLPAGLTTADAIQRAQGGNS